MTIAGERMVEMALDAFLRRSGVSIIKNTQMNPFIALLFHCSINYLQARRIWFNKENNRSIITLFWGVSSRMNALREQICCSLEGRRRMLRIAL